MFTSQDPNGLMHLMEKMSGSWEFSKEFQKHEKQLLRITQEKNELNGRLKLFLKDRKKAKHLIQNIEKSGELIEEEINLENEIFGIRLAILNKEKQEKLEVKKKLEQTIKTKENQLDQISGAILQNRAEINQSTCKRIFIIFIKYSVNLFKNQI